MKCLAKDRNNNACRNRQINDTRFCKLHQYMNDYTDTMLEQLKLCSGCLKMYYMENSEYLSCDQCRSREKPKKTDIILCKSENCKFKRSEENIYCMKHQICLFIDETKLIGKKVCANYVRGCRSQLDDIYKYSKCEMCLEKDRIKDRERRGKAVEINNYIDANINTPTHKNCTTCCKEWTIDNFIGDIPNVLTKTCKACRLQNKIQDERRDKQKQYNTAKQNQFANYSQYIKDACKKNIPFDFTFDQFKNIVCNPCYYCGIIEADKGFNGIDRKNSHVGYETENCVSCCKMCNNMKGSLDDVCFILRVGHILSYKKLVETFVFYPELFKNHFACKYNVYMKNAMSRQLSFELSDEQFEIIRSSNCYLCGKQNTETHINGIDRYDNTIGYILDNCRSCCTECNLMKGTNKYETLIEKMHLIFNKHMHMFENNNILNEYTLNGYVPETSIQKIFKRNIKEKPAKNKTKDEIKEEARLKKQKQRNDLKEKLGYDEYKKMRSKEIKKYRENKLHS